MTPIRPSPVETIEGLLPPPSDFPYFAGADAARFQPRAAAAVAADGVFHDVNAWWLADAALLVYGDAPFIKDRFDASPLPALGFSVDWIREDGGGGLRAMVLTSADVLAIVFRGTRVLLPGVSSGASLTIVDVILGNEDLKTDSRFFPVAGRAGGRVHLGFLQAYARISDRLDAVVASKTPNQRLWLAGHSLGGALAVMAAAHLVDRTPIEGIYTYGCPRVGDRAFVESLPPCVHRRFVHRDDVVARIPPSWPFAYVDAGEFQSVPGSSPRVPWDELNLGVGLLKTAFQQSIERNRLEVGAVPVGAWGLADHAPIYYATLLWNALVVPTA